MTTIPGLGDIPSSWQTKRAKWLLNRQRRQVRPQDGIVTAFRDGQVTLRDNRRTDGFTNAVHEIGYQGVRKGDLVVHGMDGFAGAIGVSDSDGKASPVVHAYKPTGQMDARFAAYALRTMALNGYVATLAKGIRERSTAFDSATLANVQLPVPPLNEQRRIADFLDRETARLTQIERLARKAGELASQRRTAVIDAELQSLPDEKILPVTAACQLVMDCVNKTAPIEATETPYRMIRTSNVRGGRVDVEDTYRVSEETFRTWNRRGAPLVGDVLFTRQAPVGEAGLLTSAAPVFLGQQVMLYRANPKRITPEFLLYNFLSSFMKRQFALASDGAAHAHMRVHDCLKLRIYCPSLDRQREMAARVRGELDHADRLRAATTQQISLVTERRHTIIIAALTGQ
ncbi:restriction endonuclease subunit S, partial [[Kitasatospora] papulosa]